MRPSELVDRRTFLRTTAAWGAGVMSGPALQLRRSAHSLVIRNALVVDGTGAPAFQGDVAVEGDRIAQVGRVDGSGRLEIDGRDRVLAPGFVDIHSHADLALLVNPAAESRIRQGITLEVVGQDGSSVGPWTDESYHATRDRYREEYGIEIDFRDLAGFFARLERTPVAVNVASMVGQGTIRAREVGPEDRPATPRELERMRGRVREALAHGAVGLSSGLEYTPGSFADTDELVALAGELRTWGYPYASHMRNEDDRLLSAVEEALHVGRLARVPVQIAHLKAQGERNYWKAEAILRLLEEVRGAGVDVLYDRYPYVAYSTGLTNLFPPWGREGGGEAFLRRLGDATTGPALEAAARAKIALLGSWDAVQITSVGSEATAFAVGHRLGELAVERGVDPYALTLELLRENGGGGVGMIGFGMSEENTERLLSHPLGMICSDGGAFAPYGPLSRSSPHPRAYGSFPRVLGLYVRERGALTLEAAVHKMSGMPAARLGLVDRGVVRAGCHADLVLFDPDSVRDGATFTEPHRYPVGIDTVVVNGVVTIRAAEQTGARAGRPVRGRGAHAG